MKKNSASGAIISAALLLAIVWLRLRGSGLGNVIKPYVNNRTNGIGEILTEAENGTQPATAVQETTKSTVQKLFDPPDSVSSVEEWQTVMKNAADNLEPQIELMIYGYSDEKYSLDLIHANNMQISAKGVLWGALGAAKMTYTFDYSPNCKILCAAKNSALVSKLDTDEQTALARAQQIAAEVVKNASNDYEKELILHDYMVKSYVYDVEAAAMPAEQVERAHSITGLMLDGKGVCEAYANTFELLCTLSGLDCTQAHGKLNGENHGWNIIKLDGEYYNVDVTADDPVPDRGENVRYAYFNITDDELRRTHDFDSTKQACNSTAYNYYVRNGLVATNSTELKNIINHAFMNGSRRVSFKTAGGYVLYDHEDVKNAARNSGFRSFEITGEYGKEGVFDVVFG